MSIKKLLVRIVLVAAICGAGWLIYHAFSRYELDEVMTTLKGLSPARLLGAFGFALASYACLTGFDYLGLCYAGKRLAYHRAALTSFTSLSIGHNIGVAALSSGAIRYRFYARWGLSLEDVAKVVIFSGVTVWLGLTMLAGIGLVLYPGDANDFLKMNDAMVPIIAFSCLAIPFVYLLAASFVRRKLHVFRYTFEFPGAKLAVAQIILGTVNFACVAACLHQLLLSVTEVEYAKVASIYVIANGTGLVSHVPGGLGVLESTVLYLLPGAASLAALIAFRVVYFLVPLVFGVTIFLACEYFIRGRPEGSAQPGK
jgi:uncharacterized membrane protein YbhN (UPF0104 family)